MAESAASSETLSPAELAGRFAAEAAQVADRRALEELKGRWTGRKQGVVRALLSRMGEVPPAERREYGQAVNRL